jgi:hypothetical protein
MASETFSTVQNVIYDVLTRSYVISGAKDHGAETLSDSTRTLPPGTSRIKGHGAFSSTDIPMSAPSPPVAP